jgi:hypothetical protein
LWVDAICINQQDTAERNHQVTQMGLIYQQAKRVIAWVGPSDESSTVAIRTVSETAERYVLEGHESDTMLNLQISDGVHRNPSAETDEQLRVCLAIENFCFERKYWSRLWIIQELVLATEIRIQCGGDQLEWWKFAYLLDRMDRDRHRVSAVIKPTTEKIRRSIPARLVRQRIDKQRRSKGLLQLDESPLHDLCLRFVEAKCEDNRDKIFGLLGIGAKCCRDAIPVDYSLAAYQICGEVLKHHFLAHVYDKHALSLRKGSEAISTSIIPTSQIFHRALEITPDLIPGYQLQVTQQTVRNPSAIIIFKKNQLNSRRQMQQKKPKTPSSFGEKISGSFSLMKLVNLSVNTTANFIEIMGDLMGKILYLSPSFSEDVQFTFFQAQMPTEVPPDQVFIADELRRITTARTKSKTFCYEDRTYVEVQAIPDEVDLVYEFKESQSLIRFTGKPGIVRQSRPALATSETFPLDFDFSREFYTLWNEAKMATSSNNLRSCRIAIEEHGFICIVPNNTRTGDSICVFRETDVVAVIRHSGTRKGRISGRAISFLAHHATTPLRNFKNWPMLAVPDTCQVLCRVDIQTLQMLTLASSNSDPFERRVQRSFAHT